MPINTSELLKAAEMVAEKKQMRVTVKCSAVGAVAVGATTFVGGVLAGPVGLLIGAIVGGMGSYKVTKGEFKPVVTILKELTPAQQVKLANHLTLALQDFRITDVLKLMLAIQNQEAVVKAIKFAITTFMAEDMKLSVA